MEYPAGKLTLQPEALGATQEATNGLKHSKKKASKGASVPCGLQRAVNTEQAPKSPCESRPAIITGKADDAAGVSVKRTLRTHRGSGGGTHDREFVLNKGTLPRRSFGGSEDQQESVRNRPGHGRRRMGP